MEAGRGRLADRLEALLQEALVHVDVRRRGEAKLCEVGGDVVAGDVDVVLLGYALRRGGGRRLGVAGWDCLARPREGRGGARAVPGQSIRSRDGVRTAPCQSLA